MHVDNPLFSGQTPLRTQILPFCMAQPSTSEPDPSRANLGATEVLRARADDARFETDFAQLAACFSAQSGGALSPELSTELALEIVLNEVVEQACLTTGATGAAIALARDGEMVCRASSGATAPTLGSRMDAASGLSGEAMRTRRTQRSDDVLADSRVDLEASQRLGVHSIMVMPLIRDDELVGLFELFSSLPRAFGERDELTLEALALRILSSLERAAAPLLPPNEPLPIPEMPEIGQQVTEISQQENAPEIPQGSSPRSEFDSVAWALRAAVLVCAVMLGLLLGRHLWTRKVVVQPRPVAPLSASRNIATPISGAATNPPSEARTPGKQAASVSAAQQERSSKSTEKAVPPGGLLVFENGKEIFRMSPAGNESAAENNHAGSDGKRIDASSAGLGSVVERASSEEPEKALEPSLASAEDGLVHRVEPQYPEQARQQGIQGAVVLEVQIGGEGAVQDVKVVSGPPELAQASIDAVKQWRFNPRRVNGNAVPMETRVTLNFRLP